MVKNIPSEQDFLNVANGLLNSAWDSLIRHLEECTDHEYDQERNEKLIRHTKPALSSAFTLVQQSVEFYLKGRICNVSPYLLIANEARSLPKNSDKQDIDFIEFRTVDAQDLIKIHNVFSESKLSSEFISWFNEMRLIRNRVMHTVDNNLAIDPEQLATSILLAHEYLVGVNLWIRSRYDYHNNNPINEPYFSNDEEKEADIYLDLHKEFGLVTGILKPASNKRFFAFNVKNRAIECNFCESKFLQNSFYDEGRWKSGFVSTMVHTGEKIPEYKCFVCHNVVTLSKEQCPECETNYVDLVSNECMSPYCASL